MYGVKRRLLCCSTVACLMLTVAGVVSSATLAVLFGLHGEVSANEEAIAMLHQLILLCNVTKHRQDSTLTEQLWAQTCIFFFGGVSNYISVAPHRCDVKLWLNVGQEMPPAAARTPKDRRCPPAE